MSDDDLIAAALVEICAEDAEREEVREKRKRKKWTNYWYLNKSEFSNENLLNELKLNEPIDYKNFMRMDEKTFKELLDLVEKKIKKEDTVLRSAIPAETRLAITLRFLTTGNAFEDLKFVFAVSPVIIGRIVIETCDAINVALKSYIKLPKTSNEWLKESEDFLTKSNFVHCLGVIDGKHIKIRKPPHSGSNYFNYKKTFSIVPQPAPVIGDTLHPYVFIAYDAFALRTNVMKPYTHRGLTELQLLFNKRLSSARVKVENAFGILAARFRVLHTTIAISPEKTAKVVLSCCYLHNFLQRAASAACTATSLEETDGNTLLSLQPTTSRNADTDAKAVRNKLCEAMHQLNN